MTLNPGDLILNKDYRILELIGKGEFGDVYRALDLRLNVERAVKALRADAPRVGSAVFGHARERFILEAQLGAQLDHPNVIKVYRFSEDIDQALYIVMELAVGVLLEGGRARSLKDLLAHRRPLPIAQTVNVLLDACAGLSVLHETLGAVHRDVKPGNILLDGQGRAKIADLGVAQTRDIAPGADTRRTMLVSFSHPGTAEYASPEHKWGHVRLMPTSDVYSLGCVAFEMLTGKLWADEQRRVSSPRDLRGDIPAWLDDIVLRMLRREPYERREDAKDPFRRYADASVTSEALRLSRDRDAKTRLDTARTALRRLVAARAWDNIAEAAGAVLALAPDDGEALRAQADVRAERERGAAHAKALGEVRSALRTALANCDWKKVEDWAAELLALVPDDVEAFRAQAEHQTEVERRRIAAEQKAKADAESLERLRTEEAGRRAEIAARQKAEEAWRRSQEEEERQRLKAEAQAAKDAASQGPKGNSAPRASSGASAPPPGPIVDRRRRALLLGAAGFGAFGIASVIIDTILQPTSATPTPVNRAQPPTSTKEFVSPLAGQAQIVKESPPFVATQSPTVQRSGDDRATLILESGVKMEFVRVAVGDFLMGGDKVKDSWAEDSELPQHRVTLPEYWIGKTEVTVAQYAAYIKSTGARNSASIDSANRANHPVTNVSWGDCITFCEWASRLGPWEVRLASEAEWEKAARGTDGRIYPWGNDAPDENRLNFNGNVNDTTPVGKYGERGVSPYGCDDMAGNVLEWTRSQYRPYPYVATDGREELVGTALRVLRGGSFYYIPHTARCAFRSIYYPAVRGDNIGFRVVLRVSSF